VKRAVGRGHTRDLGRFQDEAAHARFEAAYECALAAWPSTRSARAIDTRFGRTNVLSCGASDGVPVVLLPAIAVSAASWFANVSALGAHHPVVAVDVIGDVGRSKQTEALRDGAAMSVWLDAVLDGLGHDRVHLVGLSYGGWIALNQARRSPDHLASVTAIDPPGAIARTRARFMLEILPDAVLAKTTKSDRALHRLLCRLNDDTLPDEPLLGLSVAGLRTFVGKVPRPGRLTDAELASIGIPTLLLIGERSPLTDARQAVDRVRRLLPDVEAEIVPDAGHMLTVERPQAFNECVLRFFDRVEQRRRD
jgi:pimeloyl-ACP methyl ester carboxylesterase